MIEILVDGVSYSGWQSVSFQRSLMALSGAFQIALSDDQTGKNWKLVTQKSCVISIDGVKVMTGFIDAVSFEVSTDTHSVSLRGRDKTADLVDSAVVADKRGTSFTGTMKNSSIHSIAKTLVAPFDINVKMVGDAGEKFKRFAIQRGETVFEALDRAAKQRGFIFVTDEGGNLLITSSGGKKAFDTLKYGVNVQAASGSYDFTNRFRHYRVETQAASEGKVALWGGSSNVNSAYEDKEVLRTGRTAIISAEADSTSKSCKQRASFEALYRAASSQSFDITVVGWLQSNGDLWKNNQTVNVDIPPLYLKDELLITGVVYELSPEEGSKTTLTLMRKDAFNNARALEALAIKDTKGAPTLW